MVGLLAMTACPALVCMDGWAEGGSIDTDACWMYVRVGDSLQDSERPGEKATQDATQALG